MKVKVSHVSGFDSKQKLGVWRNNIEANQVICVRRFKLMSRSPLKIAQVLLCLHRYLGISKCYIFWQIQSCIHHTPYFQEETLRIIPNQYRTQYIYLARHLLVIDRFPNRWRYAIKLATEVHRVVRTCWFELQIAGIDLTFTFAGFGLSLSTSVKISREQELIL